METKNNINVDQYGQPILDSNDLRTLLLEGKSIDRLRVEKDDDIELYLKYQKELFDQITVFKTENENITFDEFHDRASNTWLLPEKYQSIDVKPWLLSRCKTQAEIVRIEEEYKLFEERNLVMLLRLFIFLVDHMRENNFIWGVGRGSSVSSYILFLIGIHRVDSLRYNLDISDFLK